MLWLVLHHLLVQLLLSEVANNCCDIATDKYGCCVIKKCVDFAGGNQRKLLLDTITNQALYLSVNYYGFVSLYLLCASLPLTWCCLCWSFCFFFWANSLSLQQLCSAAYTEVENPRSHCISYQPIWGEIFNSFLWQVCEQRGGELLDRIRQRPIFHNRGWVAERSELHGCVSGPVRKLCLHLCCGSFQGQY